jgi:4-amino-4-deoxy-L-arabinose transferase-like glycosyltransferase
MAVHIRRKNVLVYLGIIAFSALFLLPFLGSVNLFDSDEINYAESAREMIVTGDYLNVQIDFEPFPEKPPLFFWLQVISMKIFGVNEFAARFPNVICGILSLILLYLLGSKLYGHRFGLLWILSYGAAILPFFYFKSGIIDPWFNLFTFGGISLFIFYLDPERKAGRLLNLILSAFFLGLAVLTKGPVAVLIFFISFMAFLSFRRFKLTTTAFHVVLFIVVLAVTGGSWFFLQLFTGNFDFIQDFIQYHISLFSSDSPFHRGFFGYHLVVLFLGVFPASVLALKSFTKKTEATELQQMFRRWMYIIFVVVVLLFSIVRTKLLHYSSLAYFPITFLAAWVWEKWIDRKIEIGGWQVALVFLVALFHAAIAITFPLITDHYDWLMSKDFSFLQPFAREALQRDVHWSGYEWIIGMFLMLGVIISSIQILRRNVSGLLILHLAVLLFSTASIYTFTERIEGYTQRSAIKFFQGLRGQDVYVNALGYKSFAHLFYFDKLPSTEDDSRDRLMNDDLNRDAYFVMRVDKKESFLESYPELEVLYEKDGYVFTVKRAGMTDERGITFVPREELQQMEVWIDGELFTAYRYGAELEKPVLYPVNGSGGLVVTRGFPIEPREKERVDHPHHVGVWFNFGDVNGFDFWNNSYAIPPERKSQYGRIVHKEVAGTRVIGNKGILEVKADWKAPDNELAEELLEEQTQYEFQGYGPIRIVDRITTLTAVQGEVVFTDNKEGLFAIRVDRAFEHLSDSPQIYTDASGLPSPNAVLDNEGVTGWYRNSSGIEGPDAWGKRAEWVKLTGTKDGVTGSIIIIDHPDNPGYPSCWHARGYGLFAVNNMGTSVFDPSLEPFRLALQKGESVTFRHRLVVASRELTDEEVREIRARFIQK